MNISKKQFITYLIIAFGFAWILQIIASMFQCNGNISIFQITLMITMFMPFVGVLIAKIPLQGMGWIPHLKGKIRYIFFALWMPALLSIIGGVLFFVIFPDSLDLEFTTLRNSMEAAGVLEQLEQQGLTLPIYLVITSIQAVTIAPLFNMFIALGEEVGWRGAMYPYLKERFGINKGRIVGGALWGIWHWPVIILAGYEYGNDYLGAPVIGPIVFCISTIMIGILLDYVYDRTKLIWMPSLMHGAVNAFTIFMYLVKPEYSDKVILGPAYIGIVSMIPMVIVAIVISLKEKVE